MAFVAAGVLRHGARRLSGKRKKLGIDSAADAAAAPRPLQMRLQSLPARALLGDRLRGFYMTYDKKMVKKIPGLVTKHWKNPRELFNQLVRKFNAAPDGTLHSKLCVFLATNARDPTMYPKLKTDKQRAAEVIRLAALDKGERDVEMFRTFGKALPGALLNELGDFYHELDPSVMRSVEEAKMVEKLAASHAGAARRRATMCLGENTDEKVRIDSKGFDLNRLALNVLLKKEVGISLDRQQSQRKANSKHSLSGQLRANSRMEAELREFLSRHGVDPDKAEKRVKKFVKTLKPNAAGVLRPPKKAEVKLNTELLTKYGDALPGSLHARLMAFQRSAKPGEEPKAKKVSKVASTYWGNEAELNKVLFGEYGACMSDSLLFRLRAYFQEVAPSGLPSALTLSLEYYLTDKDKARIEKEKKKREQKAKKKRRSRKGSDPLGDTTNDGGGGAARGQDAAVKGTESGGVDERVDIQKLDAWLEQNHGKSLTAFEASQAHTEATVSAVLAAEIAAAEVADAASKDKDKGEGEGEDKDESSGSDDDDDEDDEDLFDAMHDFYTDHDPSKLNDIPTVLGKYDDATKRNELFEKLQSTYGESPAGYLDRVRKKRRRKKKKKRKGATKTSSSSLRSAVLAKASSRRLLDKRRRRARDRAGTERDDDDDRGGGASNEGKGRGQGKGGSWRRGMTKARLLGQTPFPMTRHDSMDREMAATRDEVARLRQAKKQRTREQQEQTAQSSAGLAARRQAMEVEKKALQQKFEDMRKRRAGRAAKRRRQLAELQRLGVEKEQQEQQRRRASTDRVRQQQMYMAHVQAMHVQHQRQEQQRQHRDMQRKEVEEREKREKELQAELQRLRSAQEQGGTGSGSNAPNAKVTDTDLERMVRDLHLENEISKRVKAAASAEDQTRLLEKTRQELTDMRSMLRQHGAKKDKRRRPHSAQSAAEEEQKARDVKESRAIMRSYFAEADLADKQLKEEQDMLRKKQQARMRKRKLLQEKKRAAEEKEKEEQEAKRQQAAAEARFEREAAEMAAEQEHWRNCVHVGVVGVRGLRVPRGRGGRGSSAPHVFVSVSHRLRLHDKKIDVRQVGKTKRVALGSTSGGGVRFNQRFTFALSRHDHGHLKIDVHFAEEGGESSVGKVEVDLHDVRSEAEDNEEADEMHLEWHPLSASSSSSSPAVLLLLQMDFDGSQDLRSLATHHHIPAETMSNRQIHMMYHPELATKSKRLFLEGLDAASAAAPAPPPRQRTEPPQRRRTKSSRVADYSHLDTDSSDESDDGLERRRHRHHVHGRHVYHQPHKKEERANIHKRSLKHAHAHHHGYDANSSDTGSRSYSSSGSEYSEEEGGGERDSRSRVEQRATTSRSRSTSRRGGGRGRRRREEEGADEGRRVRNAVSSATAIRERGNDWYNKGVVL